MDAGVAAALRRWRQEHPETDRPFGDLPDDQRQAFRLREHLLLAGVDRTELHVTTEARLRMRVHDLRATFVTLSLANGKSETWVQDRTGHKSSAMIARYRRAARTLADVGAGPLRPLLEALAWESSGPCQKDARVADASASDTADSGSEGAQLQPISNRLESARGVASGTESPESSVSSVPSVPIDAPIGENVAPSDRPRSRGRSALSRRTISGARVPDDDAPKGAA